MKNDPLADAVKGHYEGITADRLRRQMANRGRKRAVFLSAGAVTAALAVVLLLALPRELSAQEIMDEAAQSLRDVGTMRMESMVRKEKEWVTMGTFYVTPEKTMSKLWVGEKWEMWLLAQGDVQYSWIKNLDVMRKQTGPRDYLDRTAGSVFEMVKSGFVDTMGPGSDDTRNRRLAGKESITLPDGRAGYRLKYGAHSRTSDVNGEIIEGPEEWWYELVVEKETMLPQSVTMRYDRDPNYASRLVFSYGHSFDHVFPTFPPTEDALDVEQIRSDLVALGEEAKKKREAITAVWRTPHDLLFIARHARLPKHIADDQGRTWVHIRPFQTPVEVGAALYVCETGKFEHDATFEGLKPAWQDKPNEWPVQALAFDVGNQLVEAEKSARRVREVWRLQQKPPSE